MAHPHSLPSPLPCGGAGFSHGCAITRMSKTVRLIAVYVYEKEILLLCCLKQAIEQLD